MQKGYLPIGNYKIFEKKTWLQGTSDYNSSPEAKYATDQNLLDGVNAFNYSKIIAQRFTTQEMKKNFDHKVFKERINFIQQLQCQYYPKMVFTTMQGNAYYTIYEGFEGTSLRTLALKGIILSEDEIYMIACAILESYEPFFQNQIAHKEIK